MEKADHDAELQMLLGAAEARRNHSKGARRDGEMVMDRHEHQNMAASGLSIAVACISMHATRY